MTVRETFLDTSAAVAEWLGAAVVARAWESPSVLEGYTVGGLSGHLLQSIERVERFLDGGPGERTRLMPAAEYYALAASFEAGENDSEINVRLREMGEQDGASGHRAIVERFARATERLRRRLPGTPADQRVPVMRVADAAADLDGYLVTRLVELTVHADDIAASVPCGLPALPAEAYRLTTELLVQVAVLRVGAPEVVRGLTRPDRARPDALRTI